MKNYTVRVDGDFVGVIKARTAYHAAVALAGRVNDIEVTQCNNGVVSEFDLVLTDDKSL